MIDLTFTNQENVVNWLIDHKAITDSDIRFNIITSENLSLNPLLTAIKYNIKKADWKEFNEYLKTNAFNIKG